MIRRQWDRTWAEPNLRCSGRDIGGQRYEWLTSGTDAQTVLTSLESKGWSDLTVTEFDFKQHIQQAGELLKKHHLDVISGRKPHFRDDWWSILKSHIFAIFLNKCAYCEAHVLDVSPGDVEHFRPKGRVTDDPLHPGYYWLAYEPKNYLPSCENCNRARGKKNAFPVADGTRAYSPEDMAGEVALLVNPYFDEPSEHFEFLDTGIVKARTERGQVSIGIYNLNRLNLVEARRRALKALSTEIRTKLATHLLTNDIDGFEDYVSSLRAGTREYSSFLVAICKRDFDKFLTFNRKVVSILDGSDQVN